MNSDAPAPALDRWLQGYVAQIVAFAWGLAEATLFFVVPDVFLTLVGCRTLPSAMRAALSALVGALIGGAAMYGFGSRDVLMHVPGIRADLVASVEQQISAHGLAAVTIGPARGIPYKIYAVEWAALGGPLFPFLLVSVPARLVRFVLSALVARAVARTLERWTDHSIRTEVTLLVVFWIGFYAFYFAHFGW